MSAMIDQLSRVAPTSGGPPATEVGSLFPDLAKSSLAELKEYCGLHRVPAREALYRQGQPGDAVFILADGSMKLTHRCDGAREHVVRLVRAGEMLAESVLFAATAYAATATALEDSRVLAIDRRRFAAQLRRDPHLAWNLLQRLGRRFEELQTQTELLATHTAEQKVAAYLINRHVAGSPGDAAIASSCRRSDLASLLALAPETLCRVIAAFKRRGWIRSENGNVVVVDAEALAEAVPR